MDVSHRQRMHPLIAAASVSVILVSMLGAAALTGVLPGSRSKLPQEKVLKPASDRALATLSPATSPASPASPTAAATPAQAGPDAARPAPTVVAVATPAAPVVASAPSSLPATPADGVAPVVVPRESLVAQPVAVAAGDQRVATAPAPVGSNDGLAVKPAVPLENGVATSGGSAAGEGASGAREVGASAKTRYRTRTRHVAVVTPAEPVENPRTVPVYREPSDLGSEAMAPEVGSARTIASIDATVNTHREPSPVDIAPPQKAPAPAATYPVVTPFYPGKPVSSRPGVATTSSTGLDAAGRPRRQAMRAVPNEEPGSGAYPRASASGETGTAARLGGAAGQSLGDTIDRTLSVIVGVLGGGHDEPRPTPPRSDPAADATYR